MSFRVSHKVLVIVMALPLISVACATTKLTAAAHAPKERIVKADTGYIYHDQFVMPYVVEQVRGKSANKTEHRWLSMPLQDFQTAAGYRTNMRNIRLHKEPLSESIASEGEPIMLALEVSDGWEIYLVKTSRKVRIPELAERSTNPFIMLGYPFALAFDIATFPIQWMIGVNELIKQGPI